MVMTAGQGAREGTSQARFLRALQSSQANRNGKIKTLNRSDNKSLKPERAVQQFPLNKKTISRKRLPRNGHRAVHCSPQQIPHLPKDVHRRCDFRMRAGNGIWQHLWGEGAKTVGCAQM